MNEECLICKAPLEYLDADEEMISLKKAIRVSEWLFSCLKRVKRCLNEVKTKKRCPIILI